MQTLISSISDVSTLSSVLKAQTPTDAAGERLTLRSLQDNPDTLGSWLCHDGVKYNSLQYIETSKRDVSCCIKISQGNTYTLRYSETSQRHITSTDLSYALTNST